ncbi:hypothetical protein [Calycomorphotria hydatis]|uniref:Uncharacterized protein n=1 Tax=Calycomorphotria hydatis TaxID=2528027 RepID=A0A517TA78_9PLAN|nr:hypothetical protein [Calycomorphotria hydatis]QDT65274.1 hypothetical protein V22_25210 [Calycomorphotria hydatis]
MRIIITDLTRFRPGNPDVCTAGVAEDGTVIRPMPYLSIENCRKLNIHPGGILEGQFTLKNSPAPHVEDANHGKLTFHGACSSVKFRETLEKTTYPNISEGFGVPIIKREKCIPTTSPPVRSLITIKINPLSFSIVQDSYHPERLKAHFSDRAGIEMAFVSVTDRGFYDYAQQHREDLRSFLEIQRFIHSQEELYLRLGLSRSFEAPDGRNGFWIQLNGIYTFPDKLEYIRCYE